MGKLLAILAVVAVGVGAFFLFEKGEQHRSDASASSVCAIVGIDGVKPARKPWGPATHTYAQEVWLSYLPEDPANAKGYHYPRTREEALALVRSVCKRVHAGEDIGDLAKKYSNLPGGIARGFVILPVNGEDPDLRDLEIMATPMGKVTRIVEWNEGFWFAKPVPKATGVELQREFERWNRLAARSRVIVRMYKNCYPRRHERDKVTREQARGWTERILLEIKEGKSFEEMARKYSDDPDSRERGGLMVTEDPRTGKETEWIRIGDRKYGKTLVRCILGEAPVGKLYDEILDTPYGFMIVKVLERRE